MSYTSNTWTGKDTEDPQRVASWMNNIEGGLSAVANGGSIPASGTPLANVLNTLARIARPGRAAIPTLMASPPTVALGVANAASSIASSVLVAPWETSCFTYYGSVPAFSNITPADTYQSNTTTAGYGGIYQSGHTSSPPMAVGFDFDTSDGKFEVKMRGAGSRECRVLVNGQYVSQLATFAPPSDNNTYFGLVTLAAAGRYQIRLEFDTSAKFLGVQTLPGNVLTATTPPPARWIVVGDSFTEPTIVDSGDYHKWDAWVQKLSYLLGVDIWSAGKSGTGYLAPASDVKFRDRLATDVIANNPDVVVFAGGINDYGSYTAAAIGAEAALCFSTITAALPNCQIIVLSPFYGQGWQSYPTNLLATADAIKAAAVAAGATYLDLLRFAAPTHGAAGGISGAAPAASTLLAGTSASATTFTTGVKYPVGTYLQIGSDSNAEVRKVTANSGASSPYTITVAALARTHNSADAVTPVGAGYVTGTGKQGTTTGDGTADRLTGSDGTHPTVSGHENIAKTVATLYAASLLT